MTLPATLRLGTRGSDLALWQTRRVAARIEGALGIRCELVIIQTLGDRDQRRPLAELAAREGWPVPDGEGSGSAGGVFTKEIERALLAREVDLAVHSLKDLPTLFPEGLVLAAVPERVDPCDLLLTGGTPTPPVGGPPVGGLPLREGARLGTSSRRRRAQILALRPDLAVEEIRGNVPTRVEKLRRGDYNAIVLAAAGVERLALDLAGLRAERLALEVVLPAPGQGALAVEARAADEELVRALRLSIHDEAAAALVDAERRLLRAIEGGCSVPLGTLATREADGRVRLEAVLGPVDMPARGARPRLRRALVRAEDAEGAARMAMAVLAPDGPPHPDPLPRGAGERGSRVLVLRDPEDAADLLDELARRGIRAHAEAAIEVVPLAAPAVVRAAIESLPEGAAVLVASARAAALLADSAALLATRRVGAVGPATAAALARERIAVDLVTDGAEGGAGLARALLAKSPAHALPVLLPAAKDGRPELADALRAAGHDVRALVLYETRARPVAALAETWNAIVVASPSAVDSLPAPPLRAKLVAIGETTAATLRARGHAVAAVAPRPTTAGLIEALTPHL